MIQKYSYGTPFETEAVTAILPVSDGKPEFGTISLKNGFTYTCPLAEEDIVYGLGESNRGINKRGYIYISNCTDDARHTEEKVSLR